MVEVFYFADRNKDGVVTVEELAVIETVDQAAFRAADKRRRRQAHRRGVRRLPDDRFRRRRQEQRRRADLR